MGPKTSVPQSPAPRWRASAQAAARLLQFGVIALTLGLFVASLPLTYRQLRAVCAAPPCPPDQLNWKGVETLAGFGLPPEFPAGVFTALSVLFAGVYTASALLLIARKPQEPLTIFVSVMLVTFGAATFTGATRGLAEAPAVWRLAAEVVQFFGNLAIMAFFFVFPTGRFAPRWTVIVMGVWAAVQLGRHFAPDSDLDLERLSQFAYDLVFFGGLLGGLAAQIYRYRRVSNAGQRQQTKWVVFGLMLGVGGFLAANLLTRQLSDSGGRDILLLLGLNAVMAGSMLLLPISISVAVLRYRLWDIDPLINRALVYGALTALIIGVYVVIVGALGAAFQAQGNLAISIIATGVAAWLFDPARARLQRTVNRVMYGERDDPYAVIARLGRRLEGALASEAMLPAVVETVREALKLPYAEVALLNEDGEWGVAASAGAPAPPALDLPLIYQGETVGHLRLAPRAPGEPFTPADRRLLNDLARQAGAAAQAVRLRRALQHSRERLVTAREEERRRLRRDLHDGLGPQLASHMLKLEVARDSVRANPERAAALLTDLIGKSQGLLADLRRLVYALRPPALDELGLAAALRELAAQSESNGTRVSVDAPEALPPLPAAVEVAAYRIVQEALHNVLRHAQARACAVTLTLSADPPALRVQVTDDGRGLPARAARRAGVGLHSMRERAEELGGSCRVEPAAGGGTRVWAELPLAGGL